MSFSLYPRTGPASNTSIEPPLTQVIGYVVVVGIGLVIAFGEPIQFIQETMDWYHSGMIFVTRILKKTVGEDNEKTEM